MRALRDALALFVKALRISDSEWFATLDLDVRDVIIAGVMQNFGFVYELSVKMLKRQPEIDALDPAEIDRASARDLIRLAAERGYIRDVEAWFAYRNLRNLTVHTYDRGRAQQVFEDVPAFLIEATALYDALALRNAR